MFPGFKAIFDATGTPPVCIVSHEFASIFEGVSYVRPWSVPLHWWKDVGQARAMGEARFGHCLVPKFWDEPGAKEPFKLNGETPVTLQLHGRKMQVPESEWESYALAQWRYAGFSAQQFFDLPLVFDRRSAQREELLRRKTFKTDRLKLLVNLSQTGTSPFLYIQEIVSLLDMERYEVVDLSQVRAERIYDLLGLYDHAAGLVTTDTATVHLAAASPVPYIALINDGGAGSIPKGNCVLSVRYSKVRQSVAQISEALESLKYEKHPDRESQQRLDRSTVLAMS